MIQEDGYRLSCRARLRADGDVRKALRDLSRNPKPTSPSPSLGAVIALVGTSPVHGGAPPSAGAVEPSSYVPGANADDARIIGRQAQGNLSNARCFSQVRVEEIEIIVFGQLEQGLLFYFDDETPLWRAKTGSQGQRVDIP